MNVLLLGSGGREHALAWKIAQSPLCSKLWIAPGNPGTTGCGENVALSPVDFDGLKAFCTQKKVDLVVVGPEAPLVAGIVDNFSADPATADIPVIGPTRDAAQLEGSKSFAKRFMLRHGIPTAAYREFNAGQLEQALAALPEFGLPVVLKADGLAAGKGVLICPTQTEAESELRAMLAGKFGEASTTVVLEAFLTGREMSVFALSDGQNYVLLPSAKDYKRIGEGDSGLNTGGMGAVCPVPFASPGLMQRIEERMVRPTLEGLKKDGLVYQGFIYFGLMIVGDNPFLIEYNCRLGDPETQAVMPMIKSDLLALLARVSGEGLKGASLQLEPGYAATVILASGGYPDTYQTGLEISGWSQAGDSLVFHAGTALSPDGRLITSGGRVLASTGRGGSLTDALQQAYAQAGKLNFEKKFIRKDIGFDAI
ncbi:MAG: phosphoribosylamine--glycine ligase [Bacteroidetes bacterium]|nr:phosphoribosylamine--glycine ligase [Bacteroidota bacterium]